MSSELSIAGLSEVALQSQLQPIMKQLTWAVRYSCSSLHTIINLFMNATYAFLSKTEIPFEMFQRDIYRTGLWCYTFVTVVSSARISIIPHCCPCCYYGILFLLLLFVFVLSFFLCMMTEGRFPQDPSTWTLSYGHFQAQMYVHLTLVTWPLTTTYYYASTPSCGCLRT